MNTIKSIRIRLEVLDHDENVIEKRGWSMADVDEWDADFLAQETETVIAETVRYIQNDHPNLYGVQARFWLTRDGEEEEKATSNSYIVTDMQSYTDDVDFPSLYGAMARNVMEYELGISKGVEA